MEPEVEHRITHIEDRLSCIEKEQSFYAAIVQEVNKNLSRQIEVIDKLNSTMISVQLAMTTMTQKLELNTSKVQEIENDIDAIKLKLETKPEYPTQEIEELKKKLAESEKKISESEEKGKIDLIVLFKDFFVKNFAWIILVIVYVIFELISEGKLNP